MGKKSLSLGLAVLLLGCATAPTTTATDQTAGQPGAEPTSTSAPPTSASSPPASTAPAARSTTAPAGGPGVTPPSGSWSGSPPQPTASAPAARPAPARRNEYSGPDPCKLAVSGNSPVDRACSEGGLRAAKAAMKDLVKRGKAAGVAFECDDCHADLEDFSRLTADAPEKFKRLIAAAR